MMIASLKQPSISFSNFNPLRQKSLMPSSNSATFPLPNSSNPKLSICKPLHVSEVEGFGLSSGLRQRKPLIKCEAYEADRSEPIDPIVETPEAGSTEAAKSVKIGLYFAVWWALNVVFNIYNKKVLNAFPYPWLTSTLSLATGSLMMLISWGTKIAETPNTDFEFWKTLFPL